MGQGYHIPVLLHDCIDGLAIEPHGTYVDVTFGGGGHSRLILEHLDDGRLFAFDQDEDAEGNRPDDSRLTFIRQNFRFMRNHLRVQGVTQVDGILADLGVSSHQFDVADRGFSIRAEADLDMRMDKDVELTASRVVNEYSEKELYRVFNEGADITRTRVLVEKLVSHRAESPIATTGQLRGVLEEVGPKKKTNQFLAQVFQAIRIEVNDELGALKELLRSSIPLLRPGGRLVVLSYHSIEDRLVKNIIRSGNTEGEIEKDFFGNIIRPFNAINRKVIRPTEKEIETNSRARSARLRIAERLNEQEEER